MEKTQIKKELYKQKPTAIFDYIKNGTAHYFTTIRVESYGRKVRFEIPVEDMGEAAFNDTEPAQLLIRWLID